MKPVVRNAACGHVPAGPEGTPLSSPSYGRLVALSPAQGHAMALLMTAEFVLNCYVFTPIKKGKNEVVSVEKPHVRAFQAKGTQPACEHIFTNVPA